MNEDSLFLFLVAYCTGCQSSIYSLCLPILYLQFFLIWSLVLYISFVYCCLSFCTIFFLPLCCLFFFDIRILITPLVSSNSSWKIQHTTLFLFLVAYCTGCQSSIYSLCLPILYLQFFLIVPKHLVWPEIVGSRVAKSYIPPRFLDSIC
jgi:hypothetical protein